MDYDLWKMTDEREEQATKEAWEKERHSIRNSDDDMDKEDFFFEASVDDLVIDK